MAIAAEAMEKRVMEVGSMVIDEGWWGGCLGTGCYGGLGWR